MRRYERFTLGFTLGLTLVLAVGCGQAPARDVSFVGSSTAWQATGGHAPRQVATDVASLRTSLEQLLGHHATLSIRFMRAKLDEDPAFIETALQAVNDNTRDLSAVIEAVGGADAAGAFEDLWANHIRLLFRYTAAVTDEDQQARRQARADLREFGEAYGQLLQEISGGRLAADDVAASMGEHAAGLIEQADAYAAEDYGEAFRLQREIYAHMFPRGAAMAAALAGEQHDPAGDLRSALGMLLGEHVELAIDAMRAGVRGEPQFTAAAAALNGNTRDLTAAVDSLFGARNARRFQQLWASHIDLFVEYTVALAEDEAAAQQQLRSPMSDHLRRLGAFFSRVTDGNLPADVAIRQLAPHDDQLMEQVQVYADSDYAAAYDIAYEAYQHMFANAAHLAAGIQGMLSSEIPVGGAQTGGGGTAPHRRGS